MKIKKSALFLFIILIIIITIEIINIDPAKEDDYGGELAESKQQQNLSIFVLPSVPILTIISPEEKTYSAASILLNYSTKNAIDSIWYNLDNGENITLTSLLYFTASEGSHILYLYANNSEGLGAANISFSVHVGTITNGNGAPGGPGGAGKEPKQEENTTCQESWVCTEWTACLNFSQQRTCTDTNQCNKAQLIEKQACSPEPPEIPKDEPRKPLPWYLLLSIALIIIVIITIINKKKIIMLIKKYKK